MWRSAWSWSEIPQGLSHNLATVSDTISLTWTWRNSCAMVKRKQVANNRVVTACAMVLSYQQCGHHASKLSGFLKPHFSIFYENNKIQLTVHLLSFHRSFMHYQRLKPMTLALLNHKNIIVVEPYWFTESNCKPIFTHAL